ncbi:MAG TPA: hypothetical protein VE972_05950 [Conexibacter sp.]|jgi:hypothetical protein|nr:hypothetical protein [Conexibacter sp.]
MVRLWGDLTGGPLEQRLVVLLAHDEALLLQRTDELLDVLDTEATLPTGRTVGLEIPHVRPTAHRAEGHTELTRRLGG